MKSNKFYQIGRFFANHDRWRIGVAIDNGEHNRGIGHPQARYAMQLQLRIDHCQRIYTHFERGRQLDYWQTAESLLAELVNDEAGENEGSDGLGQNSLAKFPSPNFSPKHKHKKRTHS